MTDAAHSKPRRRYLRFSLRTLLVAVTILAVGLGIVADRAAKQRRAVEVVRRYRGQVNYRHQQLAGVGRRPGRPPDDLRSGFDETQAPAAPRWLRQLVGDDFFTTVVAVDLFDPLNSPPGHAPLGQMTDAEFARLGDLTSVATFRSGGLHVTDERLASLRGLKSLEMLVVDGPITDAGLQTVGRFARLVAVCISSDVDEDGLPAGTLEITDRGIAHLQGLRRLESVSLSGSRVTDAGLRQLAALPSLESIYLENAHITDDGLLALKQLRKITSLDLSGTKITDAGLATIGQFQDLFMLGVGCPGVTDAGLGELKFLPKLRKLRLEDAAVSGAGLAELAGLSGLDALVLSGTRVADEDLRQVALFPALGYLYLNRTAVSDAGLSQLAPLTKLVDLGLRATRVTDAGLAHLKALSIAEVHLADTQVTEAAADELRSAKKIYVSTTGNPQSEPLATDNQTPHATATQ